MTFSIVARCPANGMLGVAAASKTLAVGRSVAYCRAAVGAIATQAFVNPYLGIDGLMLLEHGLAAERAMERLVANDHGRDLRQVAIVDRDGRVAAYTGSRCIPWAGQFLGGGYVCLGNIISGEQVLSAMARAFENSIGEELPERLLQALQAGQEAGGDRPGGRGRQSAALKVVAVEEYPYCDLRVDDHPEPVAELRRLWEIFKSEELPDLDTIPTRDNPTPNWERTIRIREEMEASVESEASLAAWKQGAKES